MYYQLWDIETRNLLYDFDTLEEALDAAHELTELNAGHYPENLALCHMDDDHKPTWVARGEDVLRLSAQRPAV